MANTEDYLDGLLDSITQAKNEEDRVAERGARGRSRREERRSRVRPDDDFMEATGLSSYRREQRRSRRERRHSEEDFLRSFEDELSMSDADEVIRSFERELRSDAENEFRLDDETAGAADMDDDDDFFAAGLLDDGAEEQSPADAVLSGIADIVSEAKRVATGGDEIPLEEDGADDIPLDTAESEAAEEDEAALDIPSDISIGEDTSAQEVPLMDESGENMDLMDMLAGEGEEDLMDIGDLLTSDEEETELEEGREAFEAAAEGVAEGGEGVEEAEEGAEAASDGAAAEGGEAGAEDGEAKPNIIQKILGAVTGIFKKKEGEGEDGEEDDEEDEESEDDAEEGGETKEEKKARLKKEKEEAKKKKKEEADAKKKAKEEEKKKKAEEKKKKQAEKAAKPKKKKPKKPKERSPKIPIPVIVVFVLFALSIVGSVNIMTNVLGYQIQISSAEKAYDKGDYNEAYRILMGRTDLDGDAKKLRNRAKLMAYMATKQNEYLVCMDSGRETASGLKEYTIRSNYQMALDSLVSGVYFFQLNEDKAEELDIADEYAEYGQELEKELDKVFNLTVGDAVDLYRNNTRKNYTAALQKIIRDAGLEERY